MERALKRFSRHAQSLQLHTGVEQSGSSRLWLAATGRLEGPKAVAAVVGWAKGPTVVRTAAVALRLRVACFIT